MKSIKIAIIWPHIENYTVACIRSLLRWSGVEIILVQQVAGDCTNSKFDYKSGDSIVFFDLSASNRLQIKKTIDKLCEFQADVVVLPLSKKGLCARYAKLASKSGALVVGTVDHFWRNTWKDYANASICRMGAFKYFDAILVPGWRGRDYALKLGFSSGSIFDGLYSCDTNLFGRVGDKRHSGQSISEWPKRFLFVGQFIKRKGLDILLEAYHGYRPLVAEPWELWVVGKGPLEKLLKGKPGVKNLGYLDPVSCTEVMSQAGALVIPSRYDHWGVVIHEAVTAGLPVIASYECGASAELVQNGLNGLKFQAYKGDELKRALLYVADNDRAKKMGYHSYLFSKRYTPEGWAKKILIEIPFMLRGEPLVSACPNLQTELS